MRWMPSDAVAGRAGGSGVSRYFLPPVAKPGPPDQTSEAFEPGKGGARERAEVSPQAEPKQSGLCADAADAVGCGGGTVAGRAGGSGVRLPPQNRIRCGGQPRQNRLHNGKSGEKGSVFHNMNPDCAKGHQAIGLVVLFTAIGSTAGPARSEWERRDTADGSHQGKSPPSCPAPRGR